MLLKYQNAFNFDTPQRSNYFETKSLNVKHKNLVLGRGGFGIVIRAIYKNELAAVKIIEKCDPVKYESIEKESNILNLSHPNIIKILKIVDCISYGAIIMEYFEGKSLQTVLDAYKIDLIHRLHILCDITKALDFCHQNRIVHLDLKPQNVLISAKNLVGDRKFLCKLSDFGCSMMLDSQSLENRSFGGTARYSAPEVLQNSYINCSADIYSLAIIMWQLKENEMPYSSIYSNEIIIWNVVKNSLRPDSLLASMAMENSSKFRKTTESSATKVCKSEIKFLQVERYMNSPLTPKSYNRNCEKIPHIINKNLRLQEKSVYGSNQKNRILKTLVDGRHQETCRKLFNTSPNANKPDHDFLEHFHDSQIYTRSPENILLVESEYVKIYKTCWSQESIKRLTADEVNNSLQNMITLLL